MQRRELVDAIQLILRYIGEDQHREGLLDTPRRIIESWKTLYGGYFQDPVAILQRSFQEGACDEMVVVKDIEFYSTCEHHMLPFFGHVDFGYIPDAKVVGVSKIARLVDVFSRRLQIQERLTSQIADTFMEVIQPKGVMVVTEASHLCMTSRGIKKQNSRMVTSAIRGAFQNIETRQEFMGVIR